MVMEIVHEDFGDGNMQCMNHPYRNSSPGGICALCLQEKLGKLVSSSFPVAIFPSNSSSSASPSPSMKSEVNDYNKRSTLPLVLTQKTDQKKGSSDNFKRSKSTTASRRGMHHFLNNNEDFSISSSSPNKRGFWSFLYLSKHSTAKKNDKLYKDFNFGTMNTPSSVGPTKRIQDFVVVDENDETPFERKVSRSRSVGCGSRSFSTGEFFERISTGFGDCALRRVESQREGKSSKRQDGIKERVRCGGIFSGFMITSSSSSSSSYLDSCSLHEGSNDRKEISTVHSSMRHLSHGRSKSWGWALASPMRAFAKQRGNNNNSNKNVTPNLAAISSLLAVSS